MHLHVHLLLKQQLIPFPTKSILAWRTFRQGTHTSQIFKARGLVQILHLTPSARKSEALSAMPEPPRMPITQETIVPGTIAKLHGRRECLLLYHG